MSGAFRLTPKAVELLLEGNSSKLFQHTGDNAFEVRCTSIRFTPEKRLVEVMAVVLGKEIVVATYDVRLEWGHYCDSLTLNGIDLRLPMTLYA